MLSLALAKRIAALPDGQYRWFLGLVRREKKALRTGKPVKRVSRTIRQDARDIRWAHDVRDRDQWTCRRCGAMKVNGARIEAAHIVPRRYVATRYDLGNGLALCHTCHRWAHGDLTQFMMWVRDALMWDEYSGVLERLQARVPSWKGWRV
ncbi:MAG TPA: HNH endonuclease signature motif containing protein [Nitrospira sp.]|nr:HNH endonuclease signature motif containing protein [Nitrospira sp.]